MKKIIEINATYNRGSTGVLMHQIGDLLSNNGCEVYYAASDAPKTQYAYKIGNRLDHKLHAILCRVLGVQGLFSNIATKRFITWMKKKQPDLIHLHNLHSNYINISMLFKYIKDNNIKTIITLHDCWFFTGKCFHFLYDNCYKWKCGCGKCPRLKNEQKSLFFDFTHHMYNRKKKIIGENESVYIVAVSEWLEMLAKQSLLADRTIMTIHNGINFDIFFPKNISKDKIGFKRDDFVIMGMANKWFAPENHDIVKNIYQSITDNQKIIIVGCDKCQAVNNANVICTGRLNAEQLSEYYSAVDVFVNLTKVDSYPTVNLESIACGTPVITFDSGGSKETVLDSVTGYIVPYGDVSKIMSCICNVQEKGKDYFKTKCREYAEDYFSDKKCFKEYVHLINSITD